MNKPVTKQTDSGKITCTTKDGGIHVVDETSPVEKEPVKDKTPGGKQDANN